MENTIAALASNIPAVINFGSMLKFIVIFAFLSVFVGLLGRVIFGTRSSLNHAMSSVMGILFMYVLAIVIYTYNPKDLVQYLTPLPFVRFSGEKLYIFSFLNSDFSGICSQVLSMVILAFLVNLLDYVMPKGKKILLWYLLRFFTVILATLLHGVVSSLIETYLPGALIQYAPIILLMFLLAMLLVGVFQFLVGVILTAANPIVGGIYAFFFSNAIGKQFTNSVLTTFVLCLLVFLLEHFGYAVISISAAALGACIPLILVLLALWYLIGHIL